MKTTIELDVEVTFDYEPGSPGNTSGLPENCYPPEPETADITSVMLGDVDIQTQLTTKQIETLEQEAIEHAQNEINDRDIP